MRTLLCTLSTLAHVLVLLILFRDDKIVKGEETDHEECPIDMSLWRKSEHLTVNCIGRIQSSEIYWGYFLNIMSDGIPDHFHDESTVVSMRYSHEIPLFQKKTIKFEGSSRKKYSKDTLGGGPIGFALNGVPFFSPLKADNTDAVQGQHQDTHDACMGYTLEKSGAYVYRTAPPCLFRDFDGKGQGRGNSKNGSIALLINYDAYTFQNAFGFYLQPGEVHWRTNIDDAPFIIGYALDGYPIYSPYDAEGNEHLDLDSCNGKVYNSTYAYFSTLAFPYLIGCFRQDFSTEEKTQITGASYLKCPAGRYTDTVNSFTCKPCDAGRWGSGTFCDHRGCLGDTLPSCSGPCEQGSFCPKGSFSPTSEACGGSRFYCPEGSPNRIAVDPGYYSIPLNDPHDFGLSKTLSQRLWEFHRSGQTECESGFWCANGTRFACSKSGSYGKIPGLTSSVCSGPCPKGHYCTPFPPTQINQEWIGKTKCPAGRYGESLGIEDSECSGLCSPGYYCEEGSTSREQNPCPPGLAGESSGLKDSQCSLKCDISGNHCDVNTCQEGYYCPANSTSQREMECGGSNLFCPLGSSKPVHVREGYYSIGSKSRIGYVQTDKDIAVRFQEAKCEMGTYCANGVRQPCPVGKYGAVEKLISPECSGDCAPGYYCPLGSTTQNHVQCGSPNYFCPSGSQLPVPIRFGHYSYGGRPNSRGSEAICPPGSFCVEGIAHPCPAGRYSSKTGSSSSNCEGPSYPGFYTPEGSTSSHQIACPAGRYGLAGMINDKCMGPASPGYYTPAASSNPDQFPCGGEMVYCPEGTPFPLNVTVGYYSVGGSSTTRTFQNMCVSYQRTPPSGVVTTPLCPSTTRTKDTIVAAPPQHIDVDYDIDPEDQFRYDYKGYPDNI